jgi:hypothetical protein
LASGDGIATPTVRAVPRAAPRISAPVKGKLAKLKSAKGAKPSDDEWDEF